MVTSAVEKTNAGKGKTFAQGDIWEGDIKHRLEEGM